MNEAFKKFLDGQQAVYDKFKVGMRTAIQEGIKVDPILVERKGAYVIALRPAEEMKAQFRSLAALGALLCPDAGIITYGREQIHTTISDYKLAAGFDPDADPDRQRIIDVFSDVAGKVVDSLRTAVKCSYKRVVFNQAAAILMGVPGPEFLDLSSEIIEKVGKEGIALRMPWGAHVTLARFSKAIPADSVSKLISWGNVSTDGVPRAFSELVIGQFTSTPDSFNPKFIHRFPLPQ